MNHKQIKTDWESRGYSFGIFRDSPGQVWADFVHKTDELIILAEGEIEIEIDNKKRIRVGGMVKKETIQLNQNKISFVITDFKNDINVTYSGAVPNLFAEGKGVVAEGYLNDRSFFDAKKILAKHDENYMPPEVKEALEANK